MLLSHFRVPGLRAANIVAFCVVAADLVAAPGALVTTIQNPRSAGHGSAFGAVVVAYGEDLLVGAPSSDAGGNDAGAVYLFGPESAEAVREFLNPTPRSGEEFGAAIATQGRWVLIGAPRAFSEEPGRERSDEGKAYLFDGESGELLQTYSNPAGTARGLFGTAVSFLGEEPVVGAPFNDLGHFRSGGAYVFGPKSGELRRTLRKEEPSEDHFARRLAAAGGRLLVGAPFDESSGAHRGAAYLFDQKGGLVRAFVHPTPEASHSFGSALAASVDGGVLIADEFDASSGLASGAVFLFDVETGRRLHTFRPPTPLEGTRFGSSVAVLGEAVAIGAVLDGIDTPDRGGAVYVFHSRTGGQLLRRVAPSAGGEDRFGASVALIGERLAVGAPNHGGAGAVFVFEGPGDDAFDPCAPDPGDALRLDCDGNGVADSCDLENGAEDCDGDGVLDACQLAGGDCDRNGILDACDLRAGRTDDCDGDGVLDVCERAGGDCNANGRPDGCDVERRFELAAPTTHAIRARLGEAVAADFDGDGGLDLAVGGFADFDVAVLTQLGPRRFSEPRFVPVGAEGPQHLVAADFDGDGRADLATSNRFGDSVSLVLGDGTGSFSPPLVHAVGNRPAKLVPADLDGDGDLDLAVVNAGSRDVSILFHLEAGVFAGAVAVQAGEEPKWVESVDLDGDGDLDLVTAGWQLFVLRNRGGGEFATPVGIDVPNSPNVVEAADLDGDGDEDLVFAGKRAFSVEFLRNRGDGTFDAVESFPARAADDLALADLDGDGDVDVAVSDESLSLLFNRGRGSFDVKVLARTWNRVALGAADLDRDRRADLFWSDGAALKVLWNGARGFPELRFLRLPARQSPWTSVSEDFDGDGDLDVVAAARGGRLTLFLQRAEGFESQQLPFWSRANYPLLEAADLDGDGDVDLLNYDSALRVLANDGQGEFAVAATLDAPPQTRTATIGDLDDDGDLDIVTASPTAADGRGALSLFLGDGRGGFSFWRDLEVGAQPLDVALGDLDGNGSLDLATVNGAPLSVAVVRSRGGGAFDEPALLLLEDLARFRDPTHAFIEAADVDGDARTDVALTVYEASALVVLSGDGEGGFRARQTLFGSGRPLALAAADLDGDAQIELAVAALERDGVTVFSGRASGTLLRRADLAAGLAPAGVSLADMDGDGLGDLVVASAGEGAVALVTGGLNAPLSRDGNLDGVPDECQGGFQRPGDCTQDGVVDMSDGLCIFGVLFLGDPPGFPCGDGTSDDPANVALIDWQADGQLDISDAIGVFQFLYAGGSASPLALRANGSGCVPILECTENPGCR